MIMLNAASAACPYELTSLLPLIILLAVVVFFPAMDATIIVTAFPTISHELHGGDKYLANIFGRRNPMLISVSLFALGSGIAGGATNIAMLIAGRTLMGIVPANWRWVFYINLPVCAVTLALLVVFLRLRHTPEASWKLALARIDYFGSFLFVSSITSILLGLILGGTISPWSSWRVIVPLVLGVVGWALFHVFEYSSWCKEPIIPPHIFGNRTTSTALILNFISGMLFEWTGTYRPIHWTAFAIGLLSVLDERSSKAAWICFQLLVPASKGLHMMSTLPAVLAPLPEADVAAALGTFAFLRVFGWVWGISIPSIVFNGQFNKNLSQIDNEALRATLANGASYGYASQGFLLNLTGTEREQTVKVYAQAMKTVWQVAAAFSTEAFFMVFLEKHVVLRTELNTAFGIEQKKKEGDVEGKEVGVGEEKKKEDAVESS
ncbi:hypothetical protein F5882DRAFT_493084 [Hyaloscypha sp. PMI_1271]|nr:hypothetical protein F5882DRAFT_493084 [Hyaloscypha sp. PMI_1271]